MSLKRKSHCGEEDDQEKGKTSAPEDSSLRPIKRVMNLLESEKTEDEGGQTSFGTVDVNENVLRKPADTIEVEATSKESEVKESPLIPRQRQSYLWRPEHIEVLRSALESFKFLPRTTTYKVVSRVCSASFDLTLL